MKQSNRQHGGRAVPAVSLPPPPRLRAAAQLHYPLTAPAPCTAEAMHLRQVAEGFYWLRIPMPIALDHINVYLLEDTDGWWVVDTGMHQEQTKQMWQALRQHPVLQNRPVRRLICTHHHYDHAGLAKWMNEEWGVELMMSRTEYLTMRATFEPFPAVATPAFTGFYRSLGADDAMLEKMEEALRRDPFTPAPARSYTRLQAGQQLRIGGRTWHVLLGAGHSPEHVCLYCPNIAPESEPVQPALLAGDQLIARISSNVSVTPAEPNANHLQDWVDSLHLLLHLPENTLVLPSHQGVFTGVRERAAELLEHHRLQLLYMCQAVQQTGSATAYTLLLALFPRLRKAVDSLLALGEVAAHLNWLQYQGIMTVETDAQGVRHYRLRNGTPDRLPLLPDAGGFVSQQLSRLQPLLVGAEPHGGVSERQRVESAADKLTTEGNERKGAL